MRELSFYLANAKEIGHKYRGKHIAIVGERVVAAGDSPKEVWEVAKKHFPRSRPVLAYVPPGDVLVFIVD